MPPVFLIVWIVACVVFGIIGFFYYNSLVFDLKVKLEEEKIYVSHTRLDWYCRINSINKFIKDLELDKEKEEKLLQISNKITKTHKKSGKIVIALFVILFSYFGILFLIN